jgi:hypothetical protein
MATMTPTKSTRRTGVFASPQRAPGEFIYVSDALFVVAAIAAVFAAGLLAVSSLAGQTGIAPVASNGREVSLGEFQFGLSRLFKPRIIEFKAIAVVGGNAATQEVYEQRLQRHAARISQAVEEAGRAATDADFADPELAKFRDRIQLKVNVVLGAPVVEAVLIHDFRSLAQ